MKISVMTESRSGVMWVVAIVVVVLIPQPLNGCQIADQHPLLLTLALLLQVEALHHFFAMIHEMPFFRVMVRIGKSEDYPLHVAVFR